MAEVSLCGLAKRFASRGRAASGATALAGLDLDVADGELLVLVGPSGCGKSTALRLIAGLEEPTRGRVLIGGRDVTDLEPQARDVAMVFQGYALYPHRTVRENIAFPLEMRNEARSSRDEKVERIADMVGLSDKLERLPSELSGGERQRVAMGRAIVRSPQLFLFDEPLSNLDAKLRAELRVELVALLRTLGTTAIYVTHDQAEAMTMGDRVAVLSAGELLQVGTPKSIYTDPESRFVASFVGSPAINLVDLERSGDELRSAAVSLRAPGWLDTSLARVTLAFRPEHVRIAVTLGEDEPLRHAGDLDPHTPFDLRLRAEVTQVEPMGAETFIHLDRAGTRLRARAPGFGGPAVGTAVDLRVAAQHLLWFDGGARGARSREAGR